MGEEKYMKIWITGSSGSLGRELVSTAKQRFTATEILSPTRSELDLLDQDEVQDFVKKNKPTHVYHLAAQVYGIEGHKENPAKSLLINSAIDLSVFSALCSYPPEWVYYSSSVAAYGYPYVSLPLRELDWLNGSPHKSEYGYSISKRNAKGFLDFMRLETGLNFSYGLTTNLFGTGDRFQNGGGHVVISLLEKAILAKQNKTPLKIWGSGEASRDFLSTKDAAQIILDLQGKHTDLINIASGHEIAIQELAHLVTDIFEIKSGFYFSGENEGVVKRFCSVEKLHEFSDRSLFVDSISRLSTEIFNFKNKQGQ